MGEIRTSSVKDAAKQAQNIVRPINPQVEINTLSPGETPGDVFSYDALKQKWTNEFKNERNLRHENEAIQAEIGKAYSVNINKGQSWISEAEHNSLFKYSDAYRKLSLYGPANSEYGPITPGALHGKAFDLADQYEAEKISWTDYHGKAATHYAEVAAALEGYIDSGAAAADGILEQVQSNLTRARSNLHFHKEIWETSSARDARDARDRREASLLDAGKEGGPELDNTAKDNFEQAKKAEDKAKQELDDAETELEKEEAQEKLDEKTKEKEEAEKKLKDFEKEVEEERQNEENDPEDDSIPLDDEKEFVLSCARLGDKPGGQIAWQVHDYARSQIFIDNTQEIGIVYTDIVERIPKFSLKDANGTIVASLQPIG